MGLFSNLINKANNKPGSLNPNNDSEMKGCRPDPESKEFMICNFKTKLVQNVDGKDVVQFVEKEERVPINLHEQDLLSLKNRNQAKSIASSFIGSMFTLSQEVQILETNFKKSLNNLNGRSFGFFNGLFKEADQNYNYFQKVGQQFESFIYQDDEVLKEDVLSSDQNVSQGKTGQFPAGYRNPKSDQETFV